MINVKGALPDKFVGKSDDSFRSGAHNLKAYTNAIHPGFRKVLTWAEAFPEPIDDVALGLVQWNALPVANAQLFDFLITLTDAEPKNMVLNVADGHVSEAYRTMQLGTALAGA